MRIIAGRYRSRPLVAPRGSATRPTSDRLRESLFNILAPRVEGSRFADLYAGSGAVGLEALSRGAAHVLFVEKAPPAIASIRANLASLGVSSGSTVEQRSAAGALERLAAAAPVPGRLVPAALDIVFLDPPWEAAAEYSATLGRLGASPVGTLLAPGSVVIAEHAARVRLQPTWGTLIQTRSIRQGDAALTFFTPRDRASEVQVEAEPTQPT